MPDVSAIGNDADLIALARRQVESARRGIGELRDVVGTRGSSALLDHIGPILQSIPHIPGYTGLCEHSRGGQGTIYRGTQEATGREVAIKLLHHQALGEGAEIRFAREVQVLARLKHPHIVTIHDSGVVSGRSYIVMDFVRGEPLDRWMQRVADGAPVERAPRRNEDSLVQQAVRLFIHVCEAIQAAHVRGVIHRDLKPANILVDVAGEPHILDFGLAKLTPNASLVGLTAMTHEGQFVGSVPWASPEQIDGREDLDTRSDVYSLGVLLYHALTGQFPYRVDGPIFETFRHIRETAPTRPRLLRADIDDELETIVLRCLSKERERRYQTAGEMGRDLALYLRGEPVEAKRDSITYLARKVLRRYRGRIVAGATMLTLLVGGLVASTVLWRHAVQQRDRALAAERRAEDGRVHAESIAKLLQELLVSADPQYNQGKALTVSELLGQFDRNAVGKFAGQPRVEAALRSTVAEAYRHLGEFDHASEQVEKALAAARLAYGPHDQRTLEIEASRAALHSDIDALDDAEMYYKQVLDAAARTPNVQPELVIQLQNRLAQVLARQGRLEEGLALLDVALQAAQRQLGEQHRVTASCIHSMGDLLFDKGEFQRAAEHHERSAAIYKSMLGEHDSDYAVSLHDSGVALLRLGRPEEARPKFEESLRIIERAYGPDSLKVAGPMGSLALLEKQVNPQSAERNMRRVLEIQRRKLPPNHGSIAGTLNNLASVLEMCKRPEEAAALYEESIAIYRSNYPDGHALLASTINNYARMWFQFGRADIAESLLHEAVEMNDRLLPPAHPQRIEDRKGMGHILFRLKRFDECIPYIREVIQMQAQLLGEQDERVGKNRLWLADALAMCAGTSQLCGDDEEAERQLRECLEIRRELLSETQWQIGSAEVLLAEVLDRQARREEAEQHLVLGWTILSADPATPPDRLETAAAQLTRFYEPGLK